MAENVSRSAVRRIAQIAADIEAGRECGDFSDRDKLNFLFGFIRAEAQGVAAADAARPAGR